MGRYIDGGGGGGWGDGDGDDNDDDDDIIGSPFRRLYR